MHSVNNVDEGMTHTRPLIPDVPFHPGPTYRPPTKLIRSNVPRSQECSPSLEYTSSDINFKMVLYHKLIKDWTNCSFKNPEN